MLPAEFLDSISSSTQINAGGRTVHVDPTEPELYPPQHPRGTAV